MATRRTTAATVRTRRAAPAPTPSQPERADGIPEISMEYVNIDSLQQYEYNPRINDHVVETLANNIREYGFVVPCVVDKNNVLVTGHTRVKAALGIGMTKIPIIRATHMSNAQVKAFRLFDNKISEMAQWDVGLLATELQQLTSVGYDVAGLGWSSAEIDSMSSVVADDCLNPAGLEDEQNAQASRTQRRAPTNVRVVIGDIVFFVESGRFREWADGIRQLCDFSEAGIAEELKDRLRI